MGERPRNLTEYREWLRVERAFLPSPGSETRFETSASRARDALVDSDFWSGLADELREAEATYRLECDGFPLMHSNDLPEVSVKSYESALLKTFRHNVLENENFPEVPHDHEWLLPIPEYFAKLGDVVRTRFVVKYADGVEFLAERLRNRAESMGFTFHLSWAARIEGYYAAHIRLGRTVNLPKMDWDTAAMDMAYEFQITTQLQEVILRLTHYNYEARRVKPFDELTPKPWQWDFAAPEFSANYLGHILHYLEGVILDIRKMQGGDS